MLEQIDLRPTLAKPETKARIDRLRGRLLQLQQSCWHARIPTLVVFEGWDAAGKGDVIRKLTERLEPRGYTVHYLTDAPRSAETDLPWMWRFWQELPAFGTIAVFDRSWYRRLLLQRLAGADLLRWQQGLSDIADFERALADDGHVVVKLFFHIAEDVQKQRFEAWRENPESSWKALVGEWTELAPYGEQSALWEQMLQASETAWAPWTFIAAHDSNWAKVRAFEALAMALEEALTSRGLDLPEAL